MVRGTYLPFPERLNEYETRLFVAETYQSLKRKWKSLDQGLQLYAPQSSIRLATLGMRVSTQWQSL